MIVPEKRPGFRRVVLILLAVLAIGEGGMLFYAARESRKPGAPPQKSQQSSTSSHEHAAPSPVADQWLGNWTGPEGTYLVLSKSGDRYTVMIQSLDGPNTYDGVAVANGVQFQRNGKTETIHAGNGEDTGMKWLRDKKNCLVINRGEGFCRD